jgi:hypothetical protein
MQERAGLSVGADPVAFAAMSELMDILLEASGRKLSREMLKVTAARVSAARRADAVPMRDPDRIQHRDAALAWLRRELPGWMARHG